MRKTSTAVISVAAALLSVGTFAGPSSAASGGPTLNVELTGAAEPGGGDPDGSGTAVLTLKPGEEQVCVTFDIDNVDKPTAAHIHEAPAGSAGPVVVGLPLEGGCVDLAREEIVDILSDRENYYVNVHNADFPAGAVRGQLR